MFIYTIDTGLRKYIEEKVMTTTTFRQSASQTAGEEMSMVLAVIEKAFGRFDREHYKQFRDIQTPIVEEINAASPEQREALEDKLYETMSNHLRDKPLILEMDKDEILINFPVNPQGGWGLTQVVIKAGFEEKSGEHAIQYARRGDRDSYDAKATKQYIVNTDSGHLYEDLKTPMITSEDCLDMIEQAVEQTMSPEALKRFRDARAEVTGQSPAPKQSSSPEHRSSMHH